jgi:ABC-type phosphonate transport system ATPase subunit
MELEIDNRSDGLRLVEPSDGRPKVVLHVHDLRKHYGSTEAVRGVSFDLRQGEIFGCSGLTGRAKPH